MKHVTRHSPELDPRYKEMFCAHRDPTRYAISQGKGWITSWHRWTDGTIIKHLNGGSPVALYLDDWISHLMIDLDNHGQQGTSLQKRASDVLSVFGQDALIYRSSGSGGIRIFYALDQECPRRCVLAWAKQQFKAKGIALKCGQIEIMADGKSDRLPFGKGSCLVKPETLKPLARIDIDETIEFAWAIWTNSKILIPVDHIEIDRASHSAHGSVEEAERLIQSGLTGEITTNDAFLKLARYYRANCGYSVDVTQRQMQEWISNRHNGHSNRVNSGKLAEVFNQIDRILAKCDPSKATRKSKRRPCPNNLKLDDVRVICSIFPTYRLRLAAYSLVRYVKNQGSILPTDMNFIGNKDVSGFQQNLECELPHAVFVNLDGFDKTNPKKTRSELEKAGLLTLSKEADKNSHKCRAYRIRFNFADASEEVTSFDGGLRKLFDDKQLRVNCTRYRAELLIRERSLQHDH